MKRKTLQFVFIFFIGLPVALNMDARRLEAEEAFKKYDHVDFTRWAEVLKKFVDEEGRVDYRGLSQDRADLDEFLRQIAEFDINTVGPGSQKAFWINAYNALTIKMVLEEYPVKTVRRIHFGRMDKVLHPVAQTQKSLSDIKNKILRSTGDPRVHFVISCAAKGCPRLMNTPYTRGFIDKQLDEAVQRFIRDPEKVRLDKENGVLYYSEIFSSYKNDFLSVAPSLVSYVREYMHPEDRQFLEGREVKWKKMAFDWKLNEIKK